MTKLTFASVALITAALFTTQVTAARSDVAARRATTKIYAILAASAISLGVRAARETNTMHVPSRHMVRSGPQVSQVPSTPQAVDKHTYDPFADLLLE
jgi:hypothetical protein